MGLKSLQFLASSCVVSNFLLLVFGNQVGNCSKINFIEQVYGKQTDLGFCPKRNETAQVKMLARSMKEWHFHEKQILLETFAIDTERRNFVRKVSGTLFSLVKPTPLKSDIKLAAFSSEVLEHILDMDSEQMKTDKEFLKFASGNGLLKGSTPLCHRYGGHQFGVWADQLGDGRAHMLGEYVNEAGERWELQLKGSGLTPYSRRGDGRAVIRSSIREFLASEAMFYLGVPTSRAATLIVSDDPVIRDQFYNGNMVRERAAVVLRLAKSWFRFGSFEILTSNGEFRLLRQLADFVIEQYFPQVDMDDANVYLSWFSEIVESTAHLMALWLSVGFAHGVCNTDNFSILGDTIDYGPFRFMDEFNRDMVPNTSDDEHRYSYEKQPDVGAYNLDKLRLALEPLLSYQQRKQMVIILNGYADSFKEKYTKILRKKMGMENSNRHNDVYLIGTLLQMMEDKKSDFTLTFRQLSDWKLKDIKEHHVPKHMWAVGSISSHKYFKEWTHYYGIAIEEGGVDDAARKLSTDKINPRYVLRNWIAQEVITKTEKNDFDLLHKVHRILQRPYTEQEKAELLGLADPPPEWARNIKVSCSS